MSTIPCSFYHYCSIALLEVRHTDSNRSPVFVDNSLSYPGVFLLFQMKLRIALSNPMKKWVVILLWIALNLYIAFDSMAIFTILILYFHLLRSPWLSFFKDLKFLLHRALICLVRVTPRYFILLVWLFHFFPFPFFLNLLFILCV